MTTERVHSKPERDWGLLLAAVLPLFGVLPTLQRGIMDAADAPLHVHRTFAMGTLLASGEIYPRWVSWFHLGFGYPVFNFYPPGVFYAGGLLMLLGVSAVVAFHIVAAATWVLGTAGTYRLARTFLPWPGALAAASLWAYAPSRLFEVWTQGSLPQMAAAAFVPWVIFTVVNAAHRPSRRAAAWVALSLFGLVMTHQPITFITALYVAPLSVLVVGWASRQDVSTLLARAGSVYGGLALGAGLCMVFLFPVLAELRFVDAAGGTDDVVAYLQSNFLLPGDLFAYPAPPDLTDIRTFYPRTLGAVGVGLFVLGLARLAWERRGGVVVLLAVGLLATVYMLLDVSLPVWLAIPLFEQLRFPERFLRVGALFVALGGGASVLWLPVRWRSLAAWGVVALVIGTSLPLTVPSQPFIRYDDLSAQTAITFEQTTNTWGTTSYNEFNPRWGANIPLSGPVDPERYAETPRLIDPLRYYPFEQVGAQSFRLTIQEATHTLLIHQFYYPGWMAQVDGQPVDIYPEPENGLIAMDLTEGEHLVELSYRGTWAQRAGAVATIISAVLVLGVYGSGRWAWPMAVDGPVPAPGGLAGAGALVLLAFGWWGAVLPNTSLLQVASPPDAPAYMAETVNVAFGDAIELLGYTLGREAVGVDGALPVTLFWRPLRPISENLYPVVQLVNLPVTETWAVSQPFFPGGGHTYSGAYTPERFTSDPHTLRPFEFAKPYAARMMVQMMDVATGEPLRRANGEDRYLLDEIIFIEGPGAEVERRESASFGGALDLWCASVEANDDEIDIRLYWHVTETVEADLVTFVHGVNTAGEIITQADAPPIPAYPTSLWRQGQTLEARYTLPNVPGVAALNIGLYTPGMPPVPLDGTTTTAIRLPLDAPPCTMGS